MAHSLSKNWLHIVFSTKYRKSLIAFEIEKQVYNIIREEVKSIGCYLDRINGMPDHIHLLLLLHPSKSLADAMKQIKGASSYQINQNDLIKDKFGWQKGYGAFAVSESQLSKVRRYIDRQKQHHKAMGFEKEVKGFLKLHGLNENDFDFSVNG
ncbi:MAG: IS200/IS605 family transposase [Saprospiraceae bacterium]